MLVELAAHEPTLFRDASDGSEYCALNHALSSELARHASLTLGTPAKGSTMSCAQLRAHVVRSAVLMPHVNVSQWRPDTAPQYYKSLGSGLHFHGLRAEVVRLHFDRGATPERFEPTDRGMTALSALEVGDEITRGPVLPIWDNPGCIFRVTAKRVDPSVHAVTFRVWATPYRRVQHEGDRPYVSYEKQPDETIDLGEITIAIPAVMRDPSLWPEAFPDQFPDEQSVQDFLASDLVARSLRSR